MLDLLALIGQLTLVWSSRQSGETARQAWARLYGDAMPAELAMVLVYRGGRVMIRYQNGLTELRELPNPERIVPDLLAKFGIRLP